MKRALIASGQRDAVDIIADLLRSQKGYTTDIVLSREEMAALGDKNRYELIFLELLFLLRGTGGDKKADFREAFQRFRQSFKFGEVIILSTQEMLREAVMVVKGGAANYLTFPVDQHEVELIVDGIKEGQLLQAEIDYLRKKAFGVDPVEFVDARSPVMEKVIANVRSVAQTRTTVMLTGETGTGKGLIARHIHLSSHRKDKQFISLHCGAIPDTLLESELFGHEKGAFTGATRRKRGKFELATGGTIFLDEIGTVTPAMQVKLLQVLQDRSIQRVGGEDSIEIDVRIIAATNEDLEAKCSDGGFRKDLYYRLNVFPIEIPPLRERKEDLPVLSSKILARLNSIYGKNIDGIDPIVIAAFDEYHWPGNIRELENLIERAYILENTSVLTRDSFPRELFATLENTKNIPIDVSMSLSNIRKQAVSMVERQYLREVLYANSGSIKQSAQSAGLTVRQLSKLMKKYDMRKEEFKSVPSNMKKSD